MFPPHVGVHDPPEYTEALKGSLHDGAPSLWELEAGLKQLRDTAKLKADASGDEASWPEWTPRDMKYSRLAAIYREVFGAEPRPSVKGPFGYYLGAKMQSAVPYHARRVAQEIRSPELFGSHRSVFNITRFFET